MAYANSILPLEASYYTLDRATINDGIMTLQAGGSATFNITHTVLSALTEYFRVSILPSEAISRYAPTLFVYVRARTEAGKEMHYTLTPTSNSGSIYIKDIKMEDTSYSSFTFVVRATSAISLQLWELCPQAANTDVEIEIEGVKQSLPRLLYDYNMLPLSVGQLESTVGLISFNLKSATDLQGHLEVSYTSSEDCVLILRIYDTGTEELYTPIEYDIKAGRGNIALPHAYLERLSGPHYVAVTAQVTSGTLSIYTRGLLYTIDGGYLAEREIDAGMEVFDFSIKQPSGSVEPDSVWAIGVSANDCLVRSRAYSADTSEGFVARYSLGTAKTAALEFNGTFALNASDTNPAYTLFTEEYPYAFWVDLDDKLWCQQGEDVSTKFLVDTGVSAVSACRGFMSTIYKDQDQGLVVLYIKDGTALYRNYCRNLDGTFTWQGPFTFSLTENVIAAYVHRLNDYRLGFTLTTPTRNLWYITDRTYVGQAFPTETIDIGYYPIRSAISMLRDGEEYPLTASGVVDDTRYKVTITFNRPVVFVDDISAEHFVVTDKEISSVKKVSDTVVEVTFSDQEPRISADFTMTYAPDIPNIYYYPNNDGTKMMAVSVSIPCSIPPIRNSNTETIQAQYSISGGITQRGITTVLNSNNETIAVNYQSAVDLQQKAITYLSNANAETISVQYSSSASITLTQTGDKPI